MQRWPRPPEGSLPGCSQSRPASSPARCRSVHRVASRLARCSSSSAGQSHFGLHQPCFPTGLARQIVHEHGCPGLHLGAGEAVADAHTRPRSAQGSCRRGRPQQAACSAVLASRSLLGRRLELCLLACHRLSAIRVEHQGSHDLSCGQGA